VPAYRWKKGKTRNADAQVVGERIDRMGGDVHLVVEDARSSKSPFHELFEWDDKAAALQHRLWQARQVVRSLEIVIQKNGETRTADAFVNLKIEEEEGQPRQHYVPWRSMIEDPEMRRLYEQHLIRDLGVLQSKYANFKEFSDWEPLFVAIESVLDKGEGDDLHP